MKKLWVIPFVLILMLASVNAKCGDKFCDPGEDCTSCPDDCLCTKDKHDKPINCTIEFTSEECEKGYCHDKQCDTLEGFVSIFKKASCSDKGSINLEVMFQELGSVILTPGETIKVYMKEKSSEASFKEINGTWINPSKEGEFKYTKITGISTFASEPNLFKTKGSYYVRVKYKIARSSNLLEDKEISCPGVAQEPTEPKVEGPKTEEPPKEEILQPKKPVEQVQNEEPVQPEKPAEEIQTEEKGTQGKSNLVWYIIGGVIILILAFFLIRYEIRTARKM